MRFLAIAVVAVASMAWAEDKPVSAKAAYRVMARHEAALAKLVKPVTPVAANGGDGPLSRTALILELERVFEQARPEFRWTPTYYRLVESAVTKSNPDPKVQAAVRKMARFGCIAPVGPLVVGPGDTLTPKQFGEALSLFTIRIAHLTHQPDPKWTPNLTFDTGS